MPAASRTSARISQSVVKALQPGGIVWDTEIKGFGVRRQADTPAYFLKTRFKGRQRWLTIGRHGSPWTPDTARTEALRLLVAAREGQAPARRSLKPGATVATAVARFRAEHMPKLKARSRMLYNGAFDRFILPKLGRHAIEDLETGDVSRLHVALAATPRQANTVLTILSSLVGWAMDAKLRPRGDNPCAHVRRFPEGKRERYLSIPELKRLAAALDAADEARAHSEHALAAIRLLILTGARLNEILTLQWAHVSLDNARLTLPDSKTGFKTINLNDQAIELLRVLSHVPDNPYVIPGNRRGAHMVNLHTVWDDIRRTAGLEDLRIHDLRHSFASFAVDAGASLPLIGKLLGHASSSTTARYAHVADARAKEVNSNVGEVIGGAMRAPATPERAGRH